MPPHASNGQVTLLRTRTSCCQRYPPATHETSLSRQAPSLLLSTPRTLHVDVIFQLYFNDFQCISMSIRNSYACVEQRDQLVGALIELLTRKVRSAFSPLLSQAGPGQLLVCSGSSLPELITVAHRWGPATALSQKDSTDSRSSISRCLTGIAVA